MTPHSYQSRATAYFSGLTLILTLGILAWGGLSLARADGGGSEGGGHKVEQLFAHAKIEANQSLKRLRVSIITRTRIDESARDWLVAKAPNRRPGEEISNFSLLALRTRDLALKFQGPLCEDHGIKKPIVYLGIRNLKPWVCVSLNGFSDSQGTPNITQEQATEYIVRETTHAAGLKDEDLAGVVSVAVLGIKGPYGFYLLNQGNYESSIKVVDFFSRKLKINPIEVITVTSDRDGNPETRELQLRIFPRDPGFNLNMPCQSLGENKVGQRGNGVERFRCKDEKFNENENALTIDILEDGRIMIVDVKYQYLGDTLRHGDIYEFKK